MAHLQIIGIAGKKYSGKDTLGNYLIEKYNYQGIAYASALKDVCRDIFGFNDEQLYGDKKEVVDEFWNKTPRELLQFIGTDLFREHFHECIPNIGKEIWIQVVKRKILNTLKNNPETKFVITDVRFPNEAQLVKDLGGTIIKLIRDLPNSDQHASETSIDDIDANFNIYNNETKNHLFQHIDYILQ